VVTDRGQQGAAISATILVDPGNDGTRSHPPMTDRRQAPQAIDANPIHRIEWLGRVELFVDRCLGLTQVQTAELVAHALFSRKGTIGDVSPCSTRRRWQTVANWRGFG